MNLQEAIDVFRKGGPKGIRRSSWPEGSWLKPNDYGVIDDLYYIGSDGQRCHRGFHMNAMSLVAEDWEPIS